MTNIFAGMAAGAIALVLLSTAAQAQEGAMTPPPPPRAPDDAVLSVSHFENEDRYSRLIRDRRVTTVNLKGFKLDRNEEKKLRDLYSAINSPDSGKARMALRDAAFAMRTNDGKFVLGALQLQLGAKLNDTALQSDGTDMVLASGVAPPKVLSTLYRNQAVYALNMNNHAKAESAFTRLVGLHPNDAETLVSLAQVKNNLGKPKEALPLFEKAIVMKQQAGQPVPDAWNRATQYTRQQARAK